MNTHSYAKYIVSVLLTALLVMALPLGLGCGGSDKPAEARYVEYAIVDYVRWLNEHDPIPGVELEVVGADHVKMWLVDDGRKKAVFVLDIDIDIGELPDPSRGGDEVTAVITQTALPPKDDPGWIFSVASPGSYQAKTLLKWISDEHWDYTGGRRNPRIGSVRGSTDYDAEVEQGVEKYCQGHPDLFEYVGSYPGGDVAALKDCDYVWIHRSASRVADFVRDFRDKGYAATFLSTEALCLRKDYLVDACGWESLDGILTARSTPWWNEDTPMIRFAIELVPRYRPEQAEKIYYSGDGYLAGLQQAVLIVNILSGAIENVGVENLNRKDVYHAAVATNLCLEGYPDWSFTTTKRYLADGVAIYEWIAHMEDLGRTTDWLPLVTD